MDSNIHRKLEAKIVEEEYDRELFKAYLYEQNKIGLNGEGKPSLSTITREFTEKLVSDEGWTTIRELYSNWLYRQHKEDPRD